MKKKFWFLIIVYILLMLADGLITYIKTPDLALEGNPLVSVWGFGWEALFIVNLIVFVLIFWLAYYSFIKYETIVAPVKNWKEYISQLFFKRPDKFSWIFYKSPKRWTPFWACLGYVLIYSSIFNRIILVVEWLAYEKGIPFYDNIRAKAPYGRLDIILTLLLNLYLILRWFKLEYKKCNVNVTDT